MRTLWRDGSRSREVELTPLAGGRFRVTVDGEPEHELSAEALPGGRLRLTSAPGEATVEATPAGARWFVRVGFEEYVLERAARRGPRAEDRAGLEAPMNGVVTRVLVEPGDDVKHGQPLVTLEAMKMEHVIRAPRDGRVRAVLATAGAMVQAAATLLELEPETKA
ncbi:MAG TPA: biotin/lipoyl-containing protein [Candidatus Acidoferrales bacterium]|nr:biotin/lipoyl-containing protein [Candidatus Acidoferrales bacterium]